MARTSLKQLCIMTGLLTASSTGLAASTPAGTQITNQALATFSPLRPGEPTSAMSNTVITTVQAVCAVSITPNGSTDATVLAGERATFRYTLTNAGNETSSIAVSGSVGGLSPAAQLSLYVDANGNGQVDPGEQPLSQVNLPSDGTAKLIAVVDTAQGSQGTGLLSLVASCGGAASARIAVNPPPSLNVQKSFDPAVIKPGTDTTVHVTTTNSSSYASREVILTDMLSDETAQGLTFVGGSATTSAGTIEYTTDGTTWTTSPSASVVGIRVRASELAAGAALNLNFRMHASDPADGKKILNVATALTGGASSSGSATVDVHYNPGVAIGPVGKPLAPEGTPADSQTRAFAVTGQQVCYDHTLQNTGDVKDTFQITVTYPQGGATSVIENASGQPLTLPLLLNPGETSVVRICYTPNRTGALAGLITVTGSRGTSNATTDLISDVQNGLPELKKSYVATGTTVDGQPVTLANGDSVAVGNTITYSLSVHNPYQRTLSGVVITDPVPSHVDYVPGSASGAGVGSGTLGAESLTWNLGTLNAGETRTLTFVTRVSSRAIDGENLTNVFNMVSTEITDPIKSNEVKTPVWNASLLITKDVSAPVVTYGDRLSYTLRITNTSATTAIGDAIVTDTPAKGLEYIAATSKLGGAALGDPTIENGVLHWKAGTIPAGGSIVISYDLRVTTAVSTTTDLLNTAQVSGTGAGGAAKAIASGIVRKTVKLNLYKFAPLADIIGTVFVDRNRNGLYDAGQDTPLENARVILAGGRLTLTDAAGRYHFSSVTYGTQALRLDPNSVPYPPLNLPQDGGLSGTQTIMLRGLTSVNFPLSPLAGDAGAVRRTSLTMGEVSVEKAVYAVQNGYVVTLKVKTPRALPDFQLTDPLPGGAILKEGRNTLSANLSAGETNLTYHFDWNGKPSAATTDPVISWRY